METESTAEPAPVVEAVDEPADVHVTVASKAQGDVDTLALPKVTVVARRTSGGSKTQQASRPGGQRTPTSANAHKLAIYGTPFCFYPPPPDSPSTVLRQGHASDGSTSSDSGHHTMSPVPVSPTIAPPYMAYIGYAPALGEPPSPQAPPSPLMGSPVSTPTAMMFPQTPFAGAHHHSAFSPYHSGGYGQQHNPFAPDPLSPQHSGTYGYFHPMFNSFPAFVQQALVPQPDPKGNGHLPTLPSTLSISIQGSGNLSRMPSVSRRTSVTTAFNPNGGYIHASSTTMTSSNPQPEGASTAQQGSPSQTGEGSAGSDSQSRGSANLSGKRPPPLQLQNAATMGMHLQWPAVAAMPHAGVMHAAYMQQPAHAAAAYQHMSMAAAAPAPVPVPHASQEAPAAAAAGFEFPDPTSLQNAAMISMTTLMAMHATSPYMAAPHPMPPPPPPPIAQHPAVYIPSMLPVQYAAGPQPHSYPPRFQSPMLHPPPPPPRHHARPHHAARHGSPGGNPSAAGAMPMPIIGSGSLSAGATPSKGIGPRPHQGHSEPKVGVDGLPRLNARQRRTLRRAKERAIKGLMEAGHLLLQNQAGGDAGALAAAAAAVAAKRLPSDAGSDGDDETELVVTSADDVTAAAVAAAAAASNDSAMTSLFNAAMTVASGSHGKQAAADAAQVLSKVAADLEDMDMGDLIAALSMKKDEGVVDDGLIRDLQIIQNLMGCLKIPIAGGSPSSVAGSPPNHGYSPLYGGSPPHTLACSPPYTTTTLARSPPRQQMLQQHHQQRHQSPAGGRGSTGGGGVPPPPAPSASTAAPVMVH